MDSNETVEGAWINFSERGHQNLVIIKRASNTEGSVHQRIIPTLSTRTDTAWPSTAFLSLNSTVAADLPGATWGLLWGLCAVSIQDVLHKFEINQMHQA